MIMVHLEDGPLWSAQLRRLWRDSLMREWKRRKGRGRDKNVYRMLYRANDLKKNSVASKGQIKLQP